MMLVSAGPDEKAGGETPKRRGKTWGLPVLGLLLALVSAVAAMVAGFGTRLGLWNFRAGLTILKWAACSGLVAAIVAFAGVVLAVKGRRLGGVLLALLALCGGVAVFNVPLKWRLAAMKVPPIHDISTDTARPPQFVDIVPLRKDAPNPAEYGGAAIAVQQHEAYPEIKTLIINASREEAFARALAVAHDMKWELVAAVPTEGRIEATDTTFWFGFIDDIVIRVTGAGYRSLVDIRSVSRVGRSDVGTNARRIREFLRRMAVKS